MTQDRAAPPRARTLLVPSAADGERLRRCSDAARLAADERRASGRSRSGWAWTTWGLGVVAVWLARQLPLLDASAVWLTGVETLLRGPRVATPPLVAVAFALALGLLWTLAGRRLVRVVFF